MENDFGVDYSQFFEATGYSIPSYSLGVAQTNVVDLTTAPTYPLSNPHIIRGSTIVVMGRK